MIQPLAAGAAVNIKNIARLFQARPEGRQGIRVVLLHRQAADLGEARRGLHGVEIPQEQVRHNSLPPADPIARVGGDDEVAGNGALPQSIKAPGGKDKTASHVQLSLRRFSCSHHTISAGKTPVLSAGRLQGPFNVQNDVAHFYVQRQADPVERFQRGLPPAPLNGAEVGSADVRQAAQHLLGHALPKPVGGNHLAHHHRVQAHLAHVHHLLKSVSENGTASERIC